MSSFYLHFVQGHREVEVVVNYHKCDLTDAQRSVFSINENCLQTIYPFTRYLNLFYQNHTEIHEAHIVRGIKGNWALLNVRVNQQHAMKNLR